MDITIFGSGYVGLVTGACFAEMGNHVVCVDVDEAKVERLQAGEVPIFEPGLETLVRANQDAGRLAFTVDAKSALGQGEVVFIAVGTPSDEEGAADLRHVLNAADTIGEHLARSTIVVDKSTVPVGTADRVKDTIAAALARRKADIRFAVVSNPEFLKEGAAIADFMKPDRIIIGSDDPNVAQTLDRLYRPFNRNHDKVLHMDVRSAEMTKYAANVMLATKNQLDERVGQPGRPHGARISKRCGAASARTPASATISSIQAAVTAARVSPRTCAHSQTWPPKSATTAELVRRVETVNERQKRVLAGKLLRHFGRLVPAPRTLALWGARLQTRNRRHARSAKPHADGSRVARGRGPCGPTTRKPCPKPSGCTATAKTWCCARAGKTPSSVPTPCWSRPEWHEFRSLDFDTVRRGPQPTGGCSTAAISTTLP